MGLTEDGEVVVVCVSKMALQLVATIRENAKWNSLCYFKGIERLLRSCRTRRCIAIFDRGVEFNDPAMYEYARIRRGKK